MEVSPKAAADRAPEALQADRQAAEVLDPTARRAAALQAHQQPPLLGPGRRRRWAGLASPAACPPSPPPPDARPAVQLRCADRHTRLTSLFPPLPLPPAAAAERAQQLWRPKRAPPATLRHRQDTPLEPEQRAALRNALLRELPLSDAALDAAVAAVERGVLHSGTAYLQRQRAATPEAAVAWEARVGPQRSLLAAQLAAACPQHGPRARRLPAAAWGPPLKPGGAAAGAVRAAEGPAGGGAAAAQLPAGDGAGARPAAAGLQPLLPLLHHQAAAAAGARRRRRCGGPARRCGPGACPTAPAAHTACAGAAGLRGPAPRMLLTCCRPRPSPPRTLPTHPPSLDALPSRQACC
jgi:hypothetical protein